MNRLNNILYRLLGERNRFRTVVFLLFALSVLAISLTFFALSIGKPSLEITLSLNDRSWIVEKVGPNGLASQAGIRKGDRPIEINDEPAEAFLQYYSKSGLVFGTSLRELTVVGKNGQLKSVSLQGSSSTVQSIMEQIGRLFISTIFWIVGFFVFLKRPRHITSLLLCLIGLVIGLMLSSNMAWPIGISMGAYFEVLSTIVGPWLLLHFFLVLPEERAKLRNSPLVYVIYFPAVITMLLFPILGLVDGQLVKWFQNVRYFEAGAGFLAATGIAIFNYLSATSMRTRQQMKIVLMSCIVAVIPSVLFYLIPQSIWGESILPAELTVLTFAFIPIGMGYAVVTRKLLDIDFFIRRGVIYGLITLIMAIIVSASIFFAVTFRRYLGVPQQILLALVLGAIIASLFGPVRNGIEVMVDRFFYKDRYDYRQIIQSLTTSLNSTQDINGISRLVVSETVRTLNLAGACLLIKTRSSSFEVSASQGTFTNDEKQKTFLSLMPQPSDNIIEFPNSASTVCPDLAFFIPLTVGDKEIGVLCVSQKISRQDFSSDDVYMLQGISYVASISLHSALLTGDVSMRDTFVSVASHELRAPLTSVVGYADLLLRRDPSDDTRRRWLKKILDNSQSVSMMVDDLLNVSRIQSGKTSMKLERIGLPDILEETLSLIKEGATKHKFVVDIANLPDVLIDRDKFSQVVGNLLSNAVKYSPRGGCITLSAHYQPSEHRVIVSVADEGIGIGPEDRESLFTTFHRIQRPETRGIRGSGLGLYIAKEWTEAMGGKIWLESELNQGSTFFIAISTQDSDRTG